MADSESKELGNNKSVDFSVDTATGSGGGTSPKKRPSGKRLSKRRSSFFKRLSESFRRSAGDRGADVDTLRGTHGPDFEGEATISRGDGGAILGCGCFGGGKTREMLILIKGPFVFVYNSDADKAPKYAVSLAHTKPKMHGVVNGVHEVRLETNLGDCEYKFGFQEERIAKQFVTAAKEQAAVGEAEEVRKRLGHESLLKKRASVRYAEKVAMKKVEDQPEKPERLTAEEMAHVGNPVFGI